MRTPRQFQTKNRSYANRGMQLERIIDMTNNQYRNANKADIRKVPTPVQITKSIGNKVEGRKEKAQWVDYCGIYNGRAIIFDAKQTSGTSLPLDNISQHQFDLLKSWHKKGAVAFLIVYFSKYDKYYYHPYQALEYAWKRAEMGGRKSIPYSEFEECATEIKSKDGFVLHYLEVI